MAKKKKILSVIGTRPEAIKMAPVLMELQSRPDRFDSLLAATGQHREMLDQMLRLFGLKPDFDLDLMVDRQTLTGLSGRALLKLEPVLGEAVPDLILVHGDTTTSFLGALAGFYARRPVGHVEAGLRTGDKLNPYPEEMNRTLIDYLADAHFTPTPAATAAIEREGAAWRRVYQTGNTAIDAVLWVTARAWPEVEATLPVPETGRMVLVETHRRENWGEPMRRICRAIREICEARKDLTAVFPVHLNPAVRDVVMPELGGRERIRLIEPQDYVPFTLLMKRAALILTDSGGIQEEAPSLGTPVLVLREKTERPEALEAGTAVLVGSDQDKIVRTALDLLDDEPRRENMTARVNPYGDGQAARRTVDAIEHYFGMRPSPPEAFEPVRA